MRNQVASLAMDGDSNLRPDHLVHAYELVARWMAGDMNKMVFLGDDLDPEPDECILQAVDSLFIARDDPRRENHDVPGLKYNVGVILARDASEGRTRLP